MTYNFLIAFFIAAIAVVVGYLPAAMFSINPLISLIVGYAVCYIVIRYYGEDVEYSVDFEEETIGA